MEIDVTVILLTYNHSHVIQQVIYSIINQTYKHFNLIISDDCSSDNTYNICKDFEKIDKRINVIKTPKNLGMAGNANFAISFVNSKWIALLHHDDIVSGDCLESWMKVANSSSSLGFIFNDYEQLTYSKNHTRIKNRFQSTMNGKYFLKKYLLSNFACFVRGTALIRKEYFDEVGGMNERFGLIADVDLWMNIAEIWDVGYVNKKLIKVMHLRPIVYPPEYSGFNWERLFLLFDIHKKHINRINYKHYFYLILKQISFRNRISLEILKWFAYAIIKKKFDIIKNFNFDRNNYELFYSRLIRRVISFSIKKIKD